MEAYYAAALAIFLVIFTVCGAVWLVAWVSISISRAEIKKQSQLNQCVNRKIVVELIHRSASEYEMLGYIRRETMEKLKEPAKNV